MYPIFKCKNTHRNTVSHTKCTSYPITKQLHQQQRTRDTWWQPWNGPHTQTLIYTHSSIPGQNQCNKTVHGSCNRGIIKPHQKCTDVQLEVTRKYEIHFQPSVTLSHTEYNPPVSNTHRPWVMYLSTVHLAGQQVATAVMDWAGLTGVEAGCQCQRNWHHPSSCHTPYTHRHITQLTSSE